MSELLDMLIIEKRVRVTKKELAKYLELDEEDIERTIIKNFEDINLEYDDNLDRECILYLSTKLPYTKGKITKNKFKILELLSVLKYIEEVIE